VTTVDELRVPPPEWVTLPEAVCLVSPPLRQDDVQRAIESALADGRMVDRPTPAAHDPALAAEAYQSTTSPAYLAVTTPKSTGPGAWRRWSANGQIDWVTGEIRSDFFRRTGRRFVPQVRRTEVIKLFAIPSSTVGRAGFGGAPAAADWSAIKEALREEIGNVGFPSREGAPGWQTQADVRRWILERLGPNEEPPGVTTLKDNIRRMLEELRTEMAGN
jgi:hypothetical protein